MSDYRYDFENEPTSGEDNTVGVSLQDYLNNPASIEHSLEDWKAQDLIAGTYEDPLTKMAEAQKIQDDEIITPAFPDSDTIHLGESHQESSITQEEPTADEEDEDSENASFKLPSQVKVGLIILGVTAMVIILAFAFGKDTSEIQSTISTPTISTTGVRYYTNEEFTYSPEVQEDYIIVTKVFESTSRGGLPLIQGMGTKSGYLIQIPVTLEQYNTLQTGQIVSVQFNLLKIDGTLYTVNTQLKEVVGQ